MLYVQQKNGEIKMTDEQTLFHFIADNFERLGPKNNQEYNNIQVFVPNEEYAQVTFLMGREIVKQNRIKYYKENDELKLKICFAVEPI